MDNEQDGLERHDQFGTCGPCDAALDCEGICGNCGVAYDIWPEDDDFEDHMSDVEADADTLSSAGWGTDEDYGNYEYDDFDYDHFG